MACALRPLVLVLLALTLAPATADAASYDVWSCNLPDGRNLPVEGWTAEKRGANSSAVNGCAQFVLGRDGGLGAALPSSAVPTDYAGWVFTAPADSTITGYTLWRVASTASSADGFQDFFLTHDVPRTLDSRYLVDFCSRFASCTGRGNAASPFAAGNQVVHSKLDVGRLNAFMVCDALNGAPSCDQSVGYGALTIFSARVSLEDPYRPEFRGKPSGSLLAADRPLEGEKTLSLSATDRGGGLEKVGVVVDGQSRLTQPANPNATRCRRPFSALKPCPFASDNTLVFDTAQLANGTHTVQASVTDAAGNETRSDPVTVTTLNGSEPNGRGASRFVKLSAWLRSKRDKPRRAAVVPHGSVRFAEGRLSTRAGGRSRVPCCRSRAESSVPLLARGASAR